MSETHTYHPELAARARWLPRGVARWWTVPIFKGLARLTPTAGAERVALEGCSAFVYHPPRPAPEPAPALLWLHGGGLLFGDARQEAAWCRRVAAELGIRVVSGQYRCAPEHPFPTPLDDCVKAFDWLVAQPGVDPERVLVGGASAGGGLAAALCQRCRDRGGPAPSFQLLVYPMLDDRSADAPHPRDRAFRVWDRQSNARGWGAYLRGRDRAAPPAHSVPARVEDLAGLPPAWIVVGDLDLFHDEDLAYARALQAAGVAVETSVVPGAYHGFDAVDPATLVSRTFRDAQMRALSGAMGR